METRIVNYPYAQINAGNIVVAVTMQYSQPTSDNPFYNVLIPLRELYYNLLGQRYIGRDADGYGLFEPVPEPEQTEQEQTETIVK